MLDESVVVDKAEIREARRGLFGFKLPKIRLFGGGDDDDDEANSVEARVDSLEALLAGGESGEAVKSSSPMRMPSREVVPPEFMRWIWAVGKILKGWVRGRAAEAALYEQ